MFTRINAPKLSGGTRMVGMWPDRAPKDVDGFYQVWRLIDDRTDSVVKQAHDIASSHASIMGDPNLSPQGKQAQLRDQMKFRVGVLRKMSQRWIEARDKMKQEADGLVGVEPYKASEPWRWHHDLEVARMVREMPDEKRTALATGLRLGQDDAVAEALLRVPRSLTGLSAEAVAALNAGIIDRKNPGFGEQVLLKNQALLAAATAIDSLARMLVETRGVAAVELDDLGGAELAQVRGYAEAEGIVLPQFRQGDSIEEMQARQDEGLAAAAAAAGAA